METTIRCFGKHFRTDLSKPIDISIPLKPGTGGVNCFYAPPFETSPVTADGFIGSVAEGGAVNFFNIRLNPHGNGTHTESVGHLCADVFSVNRALQSFHFLTELVSVFPRKLLDGDRVIEKEDFTPLSGAHVEALIIRTLPNDAGKLSRQYSGSNPPYISAECMEWIVSGGYQHLLVDLPSVDREEDGGKLSAHKIFWNLSGDRQIHKTITELIYVPGYVEDGLYLLNLQIASFETDASPSKPVLYSIEAID